MKLKGINWFERNVEKLVLGITGTALLGVVVMQVVTQPNRVTINKRELAPQDAFVPAEDEAKSLQMAMEAKGVSIANVGEINLGKRLSEGLSKPLAPAAVLTSSLGHPLNVGQASEVAGIGDDFAPTIVPVPSDLVAASFRSTISPLERARHPDLAARLPNEQPFDKAAVSVGAVFNGTALRDALLLDPDGPGPTQPPVRDWWNNGLMTIVTIELERECLIPADGSKETAGTITPVPFMPGRQDPLALWNESVKSVGDVSSGISTVHSMGDSVFRPPYYPTIAGPAWVEPSEMIKSLGSGDTNAQRRIARLTTERETKLKDVQDLDARIATAPTAQELRQRRDQEAPPPPPTGRGGRGVAPGADRGQRPSAPREQVKDKTQLENEKKRKLAEIARIEKNLTDLGQKVSPAGAAAAAPTNPELLENPEVKVWAHDLTAEPGATYRYRLRVAVNNPLYGRNVKKPEDAKSSVIRSAWTDWSDPVAVDRSDYFFLTSAADRGVSNPAPRASAELYVFYYGFWRRAAVSLEPGDSLVGTAKLPAELEIYDLSKLPASGEVPGIPGPPPGRSPNTPPGVPPAPGGPRRGVPGGERELAPPPPPPGADQLPPEVLAGIPTTKVATERPLRVDAIFLDVARRFISTPQGAETTVEAILRDGLGRLVTRNPELEKATDLYKRLDASAKAGLTQGRPVVKDEPGPARPARPPQEQPRQRPQAPPPPPGGGGGG